LGDTYYIYIYIYIITPAASPVLTPAAPVASAASAPPAPVAAAKIEVRYFGA
jgi:hypothetical protein